MNDKVHAYLNKLAPERPEVLRDMESYASEIDFPIVGPLVGQFLYQMAMMTKARHILELGSGFGYSAYWFSMAIRSKGRIVLTDTSKENKRRAIAYFRQAGLQSQFDFKVGNALTILKRFDTRFDIILNDIDKDLYPQTIDLVADRLKKGGLFITDNLLWNGRVCDKSPDKTTKAIISFTERLYADSRFHTTVLPLRDGVALAVRI